MFSVMDITVNTSSIKLPVAAEPRYDTVSRGSPPGERTSTGPPAGEPAAARALAEEIQAQMNKNSISLSFSTYGRGNHKISVTVSDKDTGEVIREIPSEELQRLSGKMEELVGMVFDGRA
jgi:flagellar protein FlaG